MTLLLNMFFRTKYIKNLHLVSVKTKQKFQNSATHFDLKTHSRARTLLLAHKYTVRYAYSKTGLLEQKSKCTMKHFDYKANLVATFFNIKFYYHLWRWYKSVWSGYIVWTFSIDFFIYHTSIMSACVWKIWFACVWLCSVSKVHNIKIEERLSKCASC